MSHTTSIVGPLAFRVVGPQKEVTANITQTSAYATNGEAVTATELGLNKIESATADFVTTVASGTGTEVYPVINAQGSQVNLKFNTAAGESAASSGANGAIVRLIAKGF